MPDLFADAVAVADTGYEISEKQAAIIFEHVEDLQKALCKRQSFWKTVCRLLLDFALGSRV